MNGNNQDPARSKTQEELERLQFELRRRIRDNPRGREGGEHLGPEQRRYLEFSERLEPAPSSQYGRSLRDSTALLMSTADSARLADKKNTTNSATIPTMHLIHERQRRDRELYLLASQQLQERRRQAQLDSSTTSSIVPRLDDTRRPSLDALSILEEARFSDALARGRSRIDEALRQNQQEQAKLFAISSNSLVHDKNDTVARGFEAERRARDMIELDRHTNARKRQCLSTHSSPTGHHLDQSRFHQRNRFEEANAPRSSSSRLLTGDCFIPARASSQHRSNATTDADIAKNVISLPYGSGTKRMSDERLDTTNADSNAVMMSPAEVEYTRSEVQRLRLQAEALQRKIQLSATSPPSIELQEHRMQASHSNNSLSGLGNTKIPGKVISVDESGLDFPTSQEMNAAAPAIPEDESIGEDHVSADGCRSVPVANPKEDKYHLTTYQQRMRTCMELFEVSPSITKTFTAGAPTNYVSYQVGVRCRFCRQRPYYFPRDTGGVYQAGLNLTRNHLLEQCVNIPEPTRQALWKERTSSKRARHGGIKYWAESAEKLGLYTKDGRVFFRQRSLEDDKSKLPMDG